MVLIVATVQAPVNAPNPFVATATLTPSSSYAGDNLTAASSQAVASGGDVQVHGHRPDDADRREYRRHHHHGNQRRAR